MELCAKKLKSKKNFLLKQNNKKKMLKHAILFNFE